ncbi:type II secretion system protein GspL [Methylomonas sp. LL1]|uniref:type II secretion system protein GspL n=1 Tax=Methylomonas sp. LL1 TaxID=2785785 RepID=UPI0018C372BC|nr:type II secretion system protein GspL [Methylomonas sp. LL1]QPK64725.1 type II secretion system protein GspL [Methylomonas sp. LL1]
MAETLLVRLGHDAGRHPEWLALTETPSQPQTGSWRELADAANGRQTIGLLPATTVLLLEIELPVKSNAQIKKALPFALEEQLADDVDNYHLVWFRQAAGKLAVAVVSHRKMIDSIAYFQRAGIELDAIYPESLCLPYQPGSCSMLVESDCVTLRTGPLQGMGIDAGFFPRLLDVLQQAGPECRQWRLWSSQPAGALRQLLPPDTLEQSLDTAWQLFGQSYKSASELNLLSGPYAPRANDEGDWRRWLPATGILLLAMAIQLGGQLNQNRQQQAELQSLETQTLELFKQTFPDIKRIVNVKAQADQQLMALKKQSGEGAGAFMRVLYGSGEILKEFPEARYQQLSFADGAVLLRLKTADSGRLESFKQRLQSRFRVNSKTVDGSSNGAEARLEIREH